MKKIIIALALLSVSASATERSRAVRAKFQRLNPCPSTGKKTGACPGYVGDHVVPLCAGGKDDPSNMQWQTIVDAKAKDKTEEKLCHDLKAVKTPAKN